MDAPATARKESRFDTLRTGIAIVDQGGAIVYANPAFAKRLDASTLGDSIETSRYPSGRRAHAGA